MGEQFDIENDIRVATPDDFQEIFRICCLLHAENGQNSFSEWRARNFIWKGCNQDNSLVLVIGPSNNIKAVLYLEVQPIYYSDEVQLGEAFNYVRPDCRKSDYAKRLIRYAKRCAAAANVHLTIGIISDIRLEAKQRLYERELPKGGVFFIFKPEKHGLTADKG